jgi:hypothetical protein
MMFAAAVGHRSGRATPSLRDAPQQQSMEMVGTETISFHDRVGPLCTNRFAPEEP